jgi:hypothetical protein
MIFVTDSRLSNVAQRQAVSVTIDTAFFVFTVVASKAIVSPQNRLFKQKYAAIYDELASTGGHKGELRIH